MGILSSTVGHERETPEREGDPSITASPAAPRSTDPCIHLDDALSPGPASRHPSCQYIDYWARLPGRQSEARLLWLEISSCSLLN